MLKIVKALARQSTKDLRPFLGFVLIFVFFLLFIFFLGPFRDISKKTGTGSDYFCLVDDENLCQGKQTVLEGRIASTEIFEDLGYKFIPKDPFIKTPIYLKNVYLSGNQLGVGKKINIEYNVSTGSELIVVGTSSVGDYDRVVVTPVSVYSKGPGDVGTYSILGTFTDFEDIQNVCNGGNLKFCEQLKGGRCFEIRLDSNRCQYIDPKINLFFITGYADISKKSEFYPSEVYQISGIDYSTQGFDPYVEEVARKHTYTKSSGVAVRVFDENGLQQNILDTNEPLYFDLDNVVPLDGGVFFVREQAIYFHSDSADVGESQRLGFLDQKFTTRGIIRTDDQKKLFLLETPLPPTNKETQTTFRISLFDIEKNKDGSKVALTLLQTSEKTIPGHGVFGLYGFILNNESVLLYYYPRHEQNNPNLCTNETLYRLDIETLELHKVDEYVRSGAVGCLSSKRHLFKVDSIRDKAYFSVYDDKNIFSSVLVLDLREDKKQEYEINLKELEEAVFADVENDILFLTNGISIYSFPLRDEFTQFNSESAERMFDLDIPADEDLTNFKKVKDKFLLSTRRAADLEQTIYQVDLNGKNLRSILTLTTFIKFYFVGNDFYLLERSF